MVEVGVEDETLRDFFSFPDSEPPAAATPGQVADAAHWESFSTRKQRSASVFPVQTNSSSMALEDSGIKVLLQSHV